jgi:hypothetical protein
MSGLWLHRTLLLLAAASLVAVARGIPAVGSLNSPPLEAACAWLSHGIFALLALAALVTSPTWKATTTTIPDVGWPSLRSLSWLTPAVVLVQIALGACYRYQLLGVIPHAVWAFIAAILIMMLGTFVLTHSQALPPMRKISIALLTLTGIQVILGVFALIARTAGTSVEDILPAATHSHATIGALLLAGTVILSANILRHVAPAQANDTHHLMTPGQPS